MLTAVVGVNWGDEGKGRMVDLLSEQYDVICRYQGGNNAGHTVINNQGKFILNLLPSGILNEKAVNIMGAGMVIDIEHLSKEIDGFRKKGINITADRLKISDKAFICMPYHVLQDILEEDRLADKKYGSTRRGIAPVYGDKYLKKGIRMGDLFHEETLAEKLKDIVAWKNICLEGYHTKIDFNEQMEWLIKYGEMVKPFITDTSAFLYEAIKEDKKILMEAQLGALRDIEYGIYPYTTSSNTLASYGPIGVGIPSAKIDQVVGVVKAYSSCVGEGPFVVEMSGDEAVQLREAGGEYGAVTERPRRVGAIDIPASKYGVQIQGATEVALTKLDVLSYMDKIPVCVAYDIDGKITKDFQFSDALLRAKPVFEYLDGFKTDIAHCRSKDELPVEALNYIAFIEKALACKISYVSVGPGRDQYFMYS